jgi:hypothetical protein
MAAIVSLTRAQEKSTDSKDVSRNADIKPCPLPQTQFDVWQRLRSLPVKFTDTQGDTYYWKFEDPTGVHLGSFQVEKYSRFFTHDFKEKDRLWFEANLTKMSFGVNYDAQCFSIISATEIK